MWIQGVKQSWTILSENTHLLREDCCFGVTKQINLFQMKQEHYFPYRRNECESFWYASVLNNRLKWNYFIHQWLHLYSFLFFQVENRLYLEQGCEQDDESGTLEELIEAMTFHYDKVKQHGMAFESFTLFPITCKNGGLKIAATR